MSYLNARGQLARTQAISAHGGDIQVVWILAGDLCYKPEDVWLQPNKQEILLSIPISPFSTKHAVSSRLLLAQ